MTRVNRAPDTSVAAAEIQADVFRRMSPSDRVALACEMSEEVRTLAEEGMRQRHAQGQFPSDARVGSSVRGRELRDQG